MKTELPEAFVRRMREQLDDELSAFLHALDMFRSAGIVGGKAVHVFTVEHPVERKRRRDQDACDSECDDEFD